jgi:hypothetical protein
MATGTLVFIICAIYWYLCVANIFVFLFLIVRTIDEMRFFGKITSVLFAEGLLAFCFLCFRYLVTHNKTFQSINDNPTFFLLILFMVSAACAVSLCVATILGYIVKTLRSKRNISLSE